MKEVEVYAEVSILGAGKTARAGVCALLGYGGQFKAVGQYLGEGVKETDAISIAIELALTALREPCRVTVYTSAAMPRIGASLPLFQQVNQIKRVTLPPGSRARQIAAAFAANEIALSGAADEFILSRAVEHIPEVQSSLIAGGTARRPRGAR